MGEGLSLERAAGSPRLLVSTVITNPLVKRIDHGIVSFIKKLAIVDVNWLEGFITLENRIYYGFTEKNPLCIYRKIHYESFLKY